MGVHGLWRLIEPSGKPVPLETLENKVLAVDVSIWLHQAIKGFQDSKGAPVPNAHLLGIYHRVCKLLYFKVKPVFIFDGGVPELKKQTIAKRNQQKSRNISEAERLQKQLLTTLLKHTALSKVLSEKTKASLTIAPKKISKNENIYALPPTELDSTISSSDDEDLEYTSDTTDSSPTKHWDLHTIDMASVHFKSLPVDVRHEILTELKETRKQNSWGRLHELPKQSDDFSIYQMGRLLKRQAVQSALEDAEKEMGGHSLSMAELESILKDHGVATTNDIGKRIASDENTRYLLIKDVKQAMENARKEEQLKLESQQKNDNIIEVQNATEEIKNEEKNRTKADLEFEGDLQKAIALSLQDEPSTSKTEEVTDSDGRENLKLSFLENFNDADFQSDSSEEIIEEVSAKKTFSSAQSYMMEYSGLTPNEIAKILNNKGKQLKKVKVNKNSEKVTEVNTVELMSDSDEANEFIEVPLKDKEIHGLKCVSSEKCLDEFSDNLESSAKRNKVEIASASIKEDTKNIINPDKSNKNLKMLSTSEESNMLPDETKNIKRSDETTDKHFVDQNELKEAIDMPAREKIEKSVDIEIMSDSDSSSSIEFVEVSDNKPAMEIVIDPNQSIKDDLFSDIFEENEESQKRNSNQIVIQPQSRLDEDLISDVSEKMDVEEATNKKFLDKQILKTKKTLEVIKEDEVLVIENNEKCIARGEQAKSSEIEYVPKFKNDSTNAMEINEKSARPEKPLENKVIEMEVKKFGRQNLNVEQMRQLKNDLQKEKIDLLIEKSTKERMANSITDQMYQEAQDLLELFGVPYIIAPMEAEAQCAFLDEIQLTDGTITDDSDVWLFGGRTVYKNFFNQSKYVMEFKAEDIKHNFKLTREQMILFALLVGSDYTAGLQGVGPVTALEILAAFPPSESKEMNLSRTQLISGLKEFRSWFNRGKTAGPGRSALKNKLNNISFTDNFPSLLVIQAYLEPKVETSKEKFSWGKPNFIGLKEFAREKFGWSTKKAEEILKPVIKRVEEIQIQKSIKDFFKTVHKVHSHEVDNKISKRVKMAIDKIGKSPDELIAEEMEALSKVKQKRTRKKNVENNQETDEKKDKPTRKRAKQNKNEDASDSSKVAIVNSEENTNDVLAKQLPKPKKPRKKPNKAVANIPDPARVPATEPDPMENSTSENIDKDTNELEKYENIAMELKKRRQRKNDLSNKEDICRRKQKKTPPKKLPPAENIPKALEQDEEVQVLKATTSRSLKRLEEIDQEVKNELNQDVKKKRLPDFHKREVIHQKLRDKSDLLRNKLKAIEVFRKSKKGPGYMKKQCRNIKLAKKDAELSENSSDD